VITIGIIGFGLSAKTFHLPFINVSKEFQLTAICTSQTEQASELYPEVATFLTASELVESTLASVVVITSPNDSHFELAKLCLTNGLHVIVEKPMTITSAQSEELISLAQSYGLILSVFHNRRWDGDFGTVKKLINENTLGQIKVFESHFDRLRPIAGTKWREQPGTGTGAWWDLGSHLVDQVLVLFGSPTSITATCLPLRKNSQSTDYFHVQLHYPTHEVILHSSPFAAGPNVRFTIQGSQGCYIKHGLDCQEEQLKQGLSPDADDFGQDQRVNYGQLATDTSTKSIPTEKGNYGEYYTKIARAISHNEPPPVSAQEGHLVIKILELALLSNQQGKTLNLL
jgi:scyllo-inositol 2-dehydrogenase (NADP+)